MAIGTLAAVAIGAGALGSAAISSSATKKASKAQTAAADQSAAVQREQFQAAQTALGPYQQAGVPATNTINAMLGLGGDPAKAQQAFRTYLTNSDYGFQLDRGANALNSGYAGAGTIKSGAAMKGLENFRQGLQQGYRNEFMNALGNQQGVGLSGASALAGVGQNYANSLGTINAQRADGIGNAALMNASNMNSLIGGISGGILRLGK